MLRVTTHTTRQSISQTHYTPYNTSLIAFTLSFARTIQPPNNAIPVVVEPDCFPPRPPNPFCLTSRILGSSDCFLVVVDGVVVESVESRAIVIVVSRSGVSNAVGSGRRCSLCIDQVGLDSPSRIEEYRARLTL
jgi:hypothetical protein